MHQSRAVASYVQAINRMDDKKYEEMWQAAEAYNKNLLEMGNRYMLTEEELEEYKQVLDVTGTGIMGYVEIPRVNITLPIYHGTNDEVLQIAIGHLEGSSLPVGGTGTHAVLSGHRGMPSARLFTDIDQLVEGDTFILQVLDQTLTYEVDQIHIVLPSELSDIRIDKDRDYVTLETCTPYGINTHRLLVRGHRVENAKDTRNIRVTADALQIKTSVVALFIGIPVLVLISLIMLLKPGKKQEEEYIM